MFLTALQRAESFSVKHSHCTSVQFNLHIHVILKRLYLVSKLYQLIYYQINVLKLISTMFKSFTKVTIFLIEKVTHYMKKHYYLIAIDQEKAVFVLATKAVCLCV